MLILTDSRNKLFEMEVHADSRLKVVVFSVVVTTHLVCYRFPCELKVVVFSVVVTTLIVLFQVILG